MRRTLKEFNKKAVSDPAAAEQYNRLGPAYESRRQLIRIRKEAGLTQEEIASRFHKNKSDIPRLENVHSTISPKFSAIEAFAKAAGYIIDISFVPHAY